MFDGSNGGGCRFKRGFYGVQLSAAFKCVYCNGGNGGWEGDVGQAVTERKSLSLNSGNGGW